MFRTFLSCGSSSAQGAFSRLGFPLEAPCALCGVGCNPNGRNRGKRVFKSSHVHSAVLSACRPTVIQAKDPPPLETPLKYCYPRILGIRHYTYSEKVVNASPAFATPYLKLMRLDRPTGTWVIYLPGVWSICLAAEAGCLPDLNVMALFGIGALLMRGAGCTINDIWDKDIDEKVERTKHRPLPSQSLSARQAVAFLGLQLSAALAVLLQFNTYCILLGAASLVPVAIYPLFKRITYYPQIFLGITLNWGALLGWAAVNGACDWSVCLPLYVSGIFWSIYYDTVYAYQDRRDDLAIGVKSLALKLGDEPKPYLQSFASAMTAGLLLAGFNSGQTAPFYAATLGSYAWILYQITKLNVRDPGACGSVFAQQKFVGLAIALGIVLGTIAKNNASSSV